MSRSYKGIRAKKYRVYSVEDLMRLYGVTQNTISNWVNEGLEPSDERKPYVFRGAVVQDFHRGRRERARVSLKPREFYCFVCKETVEPIEFGGETPATRSWKQAQRATCPRCKRTVTKVGNLGDLGPECSRHASKTTGSQTDERICKAPGDIGIWYTQNDRINYAWQISAGRLEEATVDAHLRATRFMEDVVVGKSFAALTAADIDAVRSELKSQLSEASDAPKSRSSVSYIASHIRMFLEWLLKQNSGSELPGDLADYIQLPRAAYAQCLPRPPKEYPFIEEAEELLRKTPSKTLSQRRDRAIFALAFLGALRADTLMSLRVKHLCVEKELIIQDGTVSRTKNGKSLEVWWFPIADAFSNEVIAWTALLSDLGFQDDDPLFPDLKYLSTGYRRRHPDAPPIEPMKTKTAVNKAFFVVSKNAKAHYTPHSAKHSIAAERNRRPLTALERKA